MQTSYTVYFQLKTCVHHATAPELDCPPQGQWCHLAVAVH